MKAIRLNPTLPKALGLLAAGAFFILPFLFASSESTEPDQSMDASTSPPRQLSASELQSVDWREKLSPEQYRILRQAGTEAPGGSVYKEFKEQKSGTYHCAGCGTALFHSQQKFDARCGWPSFWNPADLEAVETREDNALGMTRTEVLCAHCGGHLGHVFAGEGFDTPTDLRYCINGTVLHFVPDSDSNPSD